MNPKRAGAPEDEIEISIAMSVAGGWIIREALADPSGIASEGGAARLAAMVYRAMRPFEPEHR